MVVLVSGLVALSAHAQRDRNYYTQVVHLADGSEVRLLPDDIINMSVIKANDWQQMTIAEYLKYNTSLAVDSANTYVQKGWRHDVLNNENAMQNFWVPTNAAWNEAKQKLAPYYNYVGKVSYKNSNMGTSTVSVDVNSQTSTLILENGLQTTAPQPILSHQQVLNGEVTVVENVPINAVVREVASTPGSDPSSFVYVQSGKLRNNIDVVNGISFVTVEPTSTTGKPTVSALLPQPLSTTYDIYCVLVPENPAYDPTVEEVKANRVNFTLYYSDENGSLKEHFFPNNDDEDVNSFKEKFPSETDSYTIHAFENDPTKVDTLYVGRWTMPVCYEGLPNEVTPVLSISIPMRYTSTALRERWAAYTRSIRLAAVILRPVESEN